MAHASATHGTSGYTTASRAVSTDTNLLRLTKLRRNIPITRTSACRGARLGRWIRGSRTQCSTTFSNALGYIIQPQFFTLFRCSHRHPHRSCGGQIIAPFARRVSRSCSLSDLVTQVWIRWRVKCIRRPGRSTSRGRLTDPGTFAAAEIKVPWSLLEVLQQRRRKE